MQIVRPTLIIAAVIAIACAVACRHGQDLGPSSPDPSNRSMSAINESSAGGLGGPDTPNASGIPLTSDAGVQGGIVMSDAAPAMEETPAP